MSSKRADYAQVLLEHIELVSARLDSQQAYLYAKGQLQEFLDSKQGQNVHSLVTQIEAAMNQKSKLPKVSSSIEKAIEPFLERGKIAVQSIDYAVTWCQNAKTLFTDLSQNSADLDIRWNYDFSILVIKIFVCMVKICLYINNFPSLRVLLYLTKVFPKLETEFANGERDLFRFVSSATKDPIKHAKALTGGVSEKIAQFIAEISPELIEICGPWPVIDWQQFAIFSKGDQTIDGTLPPNQNLVLENIRTLKDAVLLFLVVFPKYTIQLPQYESLLLTATSESDHIFITPIVRIPITKIAKLATTTKGSPLVDMDAIKYEIDMKFQVSHEQRLRRIYYLLRDISDVASFDSTYLTKMIDEILPLSSLAIYELEELLSTTRIDEDVAKLLDTMIDMATMFSQNSRSISRFFLYNLTTIDNGYLNQMNQAIAQLSEDWQSRIYKLICEMVDALSCIDLEDFDRGADYDLMPFLVTARRLFFLFNETSARNQASFLHPIFEHLSTIIRHVEFAMDPLHRFLQTAPLHRFWRYTDILLEYVKELPGGIHMQGRIPTLFAFFNCDRLELGLLPSRARSVLQSLEAFRGQLLQSVQASITEQLEPQSPLVRISAHASRTQVFMAGAFIPYGRAVDPQQLGLLARQRSALFQLRELMQRLPGTVNFLEKDTTFGAFIGSAVTSQLSSLLFKEGPPDTSYLAGSFTAACELLYPLFSSLNSPFARKFVECRYEQGAYPGQVMFLEQIAHIRNGTDLRGQEAGRPRLVATYEDLVGRFIEEDFQHTLYNTYGHRFDNADGKLQYDAVTIFSDFGVREIISSLGPQAGYALNKAIVAIIGRSMHTVYSIYDKILPSLNDWWLLARQKKTDWVEKARAMPEIQKASREMIRLGVALRIRELVRGAIHDVIKDTLPGMSDLIESATLRDKGEHIGEKQDFVLEMVTGRKSFHFIRIGIEKLGVKGTSNSQQFYFFLATLLMNPDFDTAEFIPDSEAFTHNLHLMPVALDAFLELNASFITNSDAKVVQASLQTYFDTLQLLIEWTVHAAETMKKKELAPPPVFGTILCILADIYPRHVQRLEYGTVAAVFPYSVILDAYREIERRAKATASAGKPGKKKSKK